jgi:hypothetical protein
MLSNNLMLTTDMFILSTDNMLSENLMLPYYGILSADNMFLDNM